MKILVTGGTGTLGRALVKKLVNAGNAVGVLTSREHPELPEGVTAYKGNLSDTGKLEGILRHVTTIIHCASNPRNADMVDIQGTEHLLRAVDKPALQHMIYVSIAGVDRSPYPYYKAKYEVEKMIMASGVPWSVVRATQFHDLVLNRLITPFDSGDGGLLKIPGEMRFQSIDTEDVAGYIFKKALNGPSASVETIAGPQLLNIREMVETYQSILGRTNQVEFVVDDVPFHNVFRSGLNVNPEWTGGRITWEEFLRKQLSSR